MDTFPIVKRKDEAKWGDYRTKRVILDIYDRMQKAMDTGQPYETIPTHPLLTHAWHTRPRSLRPHEVGCQHRSFTLGVRGRKLSTG